MSSPKELKDLDYSTAIEILRQEIDTKFIGTLNIILNDLKRINEHTSYKEVIHFITQLILDFPQLNAWLQKYVNTEDKQFRKLLCIVASDIAEIARYFRKLEKILRSHSYTREYFREILKLKELNPFNIFLAQMNEYIEENRFDSEIVFDLLTHTAISNSEIVRGSTLKTLISIFPVKSVPLLREWAEKEVSISVVMKLWKLLEVSKYVEHHQVLTMLLQKISKYNFNLDPDEIRFLLDWGEESVENQFLDINLQLNMEYGDLLKKYPPFINVEKRKGGVWIHDWRSYPTTIHYTFLKESQLSSGGEGGEVSIYNCHISGMILRYTAKIPDTIGNLSKLKFLSIEYSEDLVELPESFKMLKNLRYLYIHETGLTELPDFSQLPRLRYLSLDGVEFNSIPQWVKTKARKYHSLKYVKESVNKSDAYVLGLLEILIGIPIDNVRRKVIEDTISYEENFTTATKADINAKIDNEEYITSEMERYFYDPHGTKSYKINEEGYVTGISLTSSEGLSISIKHLPEEIGNLQYLKVLMISTGYKLTLPESLGNLKSLEYLNLSRNIIKTIPESIGELTSLRHLDLNENQITRIPETIGNLQNLEFLNLDNNKIESIPKTLINLKSLRTIYLDEDSVAKIPKEIKEEFYRNWSKN